MKRMGLVKDSLIFCVCGTTTAGKSGLDASRTALRSRADSQTDHGSDRDQGLCARFGSNSHEFTFGSDNGDAIDNLWLEGNIRHNGLILDYGDEGLQQHASLHCNSRAKTNDVGSDEIAGGLGIRRHKQAVGKVLSLGVDAHIRLH